MRHLSRHRCLISIRHPARNQRRHGACTRGCFLPNLPTALHRQRGKRTRRGPMGASTLTTIERLGQGRSWYDRQHTEVLHKAASRNGPVNHSANELSLLDGDGPNADGTTSNPGLCQ